MAVDEVAPGEEVGDAPGSATGMFSIGKTKPESSTDGSSEMKIAASIAFCMVSAMVETKTPTPSEQTR